MENDKFTNEDEIKYPTFQDNVDIRVINNNIKILDENKLDSKNIEANLINVAKESSPKNIENIVTQNQANLNTINSKISTLDANISNMDSIVSSNLEGIAKENTSRSIKTNTDTILNKLNEKTGFNCIKSIQYGVGQNKSNTSPTAVRINTINPDKTMVLVVASYARNRNNPDYDETNVVYCNHKSATQLSFTTIIGMETEMKFSWQAIEFY